MNQTSKRTPRNEEITRIVFTSILAAIIILMTFIDGFGYIRINPVVAVTIIHIPVIVGAIILGKKYGLILGLVFGLGSMTRSFMEYTVFAPFTNPIVSVLPRMFIGFIAYGIYHFFTLKIKNNKFSIPLALVTTTLIHSLIVLPLLFIVWKYGLHLFVDEFIFNLDLEPNILIFIWGAFISNSIFEIGLAALIGTPIILAMNQVLKGRN